jgi:hypothetical protein
VLHYTLESTVVQQETGHAAGIIFVPTEAPTFSFGPDALSPSLLTENLGLIPGVLALTSKGPAVDVLYVHTIQVLQLVFSIRGTDTFPATANQSLSDIAQPRYFEIPIFPPVERCVWPPVHTMDNDTLMEYSGANNLDPG